MPASTMMRLALGTAVALTLTSLLARPAAAADGWLDRTFSGNGWVRLQEAAEFVSGGQLAVAVGPGGRTIVARQTNVEEHPETAALVLGSSGVPLRTFNDGAWRYFITGADGGDLAGLFATPTGGAVGVHRANFDGVMLLREVGPDGTIVRSLSPALGDEARQIANVVRLPGGSLRVCYTDEASGEHRLLGYTSAFQTDPAVGPGGQRSVPTMCSHMGSDPAGHLYLGLGLGDPVGSAISLVRTTSSGVVDTAWAEDGQTSVERPGLGISFAAERPPGRRGFGTAASPIITTADGSVFLAARVTRNGTTFSAAIVKLTADGALDPTFDGDGVRAFGPTGGQSRILGFAVDAEGRPLISTVFEPPGGGRKAYLARLTATGQFDASFGRGGLIAQSFGAVSVALDGSGRIITAAWDGTGVIVARRIG